MTELSLRCPAKLNLTLAVGPPDHSHTGQGRHPVASLMAALNFGDQLHIRFLEPHQPSRWRMAYAPDAPRPQPIDWPLQHDLAFRAHAACQAATQRDLPVDVTLEKRVPTGAGLGGGSANAAAILHAVQRHLQHQHPNTPFDPVALAHPLGADVAFALHALHALQHPDPALDPSLVPSLALATGFGEQLQPVSLPAPLHAALLLPDFACPTPAIYRAFDRLRPHAPPIHQDATQQTLDHLQQNQPFPDAHLFNDLTPAAEHAQPKLTPLFQTLRDAQLHPHLTGSGSAIFLPAHSPDHAQQLAEQAQQRTGCPTLPVASLG